MADNRHFTDALQNEGGSPVYLEDKKLAERTAVSGAASIANLKFLLANDDTEGFNTAIKAYIDEAIRSALGALVNNLDKGTAISRILATDENNDLGTITPANLSSVLGGLMLSILTSSNDLNDYKSGWYSIVNANQPSNCPSWIGYNAVMFCKQIQNTKSIQLIFETNDAIIAYRVYNGNSWGDWRKVTLT